MSRPDTNRASSSLLRPREPLVGRLQRYWRDGGPWGWLNAMAVSVSLVLVLGLLSLLVVGSFSHFWPSRLVEVELTAQPGQSPTALTTTRGEPAADNRHLLGELMHEEMRRVASGEGTTLASNGGCCRHLRVTGPRPAGSGCRRRCSTG